MASRHLSVRLDDTTFDRLDAESRRTGENRSQLAKSLIDEGLRMRAHPGIVFRPGPAGRRAALACGPDVWEVASLFQEMAPIDNDVIEQIAEMTCLSTTEVRIALGYYAEYRDEIDTRIRRNAALAEAAEARWLREQALLKS